MQQCSLDSQTIDGFMFLKKTRDGTKHTHKNLQIHSILIYLI